MVWIKRLGVVVGVLLVLLVAILAYVMFFVNSATFKTEVQKVALEKADIRLRIDGDIQWSFFPWLGLELDDIGVAIGKDPEIFQFDRAEFGLAILPLLKHSIQVDRVRLVNLKANLKIDKAGKGNWQRPASALTKQSRSEKASIAQSQVSSAYQAASSAPDKSTIPDFKLEVLQIDNAQVAFQDAKTNQKIAATFNVNLHDVQWNKPWPMVMDVVVKQSDLSGKQAQTFSGKLTADLTVFPEREVFSLANASLSTELRSDALPINPLKADMKVKQVDMDIPQENLFMDGVSISSLGVNINAKVKLYQVLSDPQYVVSMSLDEFNPRSVLQQLKIAIPNMADSSALSKASAELKLEGSKNELLIQPISIALDDTTLQANVVTELSPLRWDANVTGEDLNVDRYLPPQVDSKVTNSNKQKKIATTDKAVAGNVATPTNTASAELVPLDLVRSLSGHLGLAFNNLTVKKLHLKSVSLDATMANGMVRISPAVVNLYQGQSTIQATYDARTDTPRLNVSSRVQGVEIQPLLKDFMDLNKLSGTTSLTGEISTQGNQVGTMMSALNGDFLAEIHKGSLVGVNLTKTVCQGIAAVRKESLAANNFTANTPFETMTFPIHIVTGNISTPGLMMTSAGISVTGDGDISLADNSLNYQANVALAGSELDHACRVNQTLTDLAFPIVCKGQFSDDPASLCRPDIKGFGSIFADLAKAALKDKLAVEKARLKAKKDAQVDDAKEKLKEKLKDKLKSLF